MVVEEPVGGIWPRKNVPGPVTTGEPFTPVGLPVESMASVIDRMRDTQEIVQGIPNPEYVDEFPVTWKGWLDESSEGRKRRELWGSYSNHLDIIMEKGEADDVEDEWMIQADHDINDMQRIVTLLKRRMRDVIARNTPQRDPNEGEDPFAGLDP